jgi:hypothetical protein
VRDVSDDLPDLRTFIDQAVSTGLTDVAEIAVKVRQSAPAEVLEAHMLSCLRAEVRDYFSRNRQANPIIHGQAAQAKLAARAGRREVTPAPVSAKRARMRDLFAADRERFLRDTIWTGEHRLRLGDATAADLIAAAAFARGQAARNMATAARYDEIATVLREHGVAKVESLPDDVLKQLMERA